MKHGALEIIIAILVLGFWRGQRTGVPFALATQPTPN